MRPLPLMIRGIVPSRSSTAGMIRSAGDAVLVERERPRVLLLACPCGCGDELSINLDRRAGPAWRLYRTTGSFTLFPSVWRDVGCQSHFIIWRDRIYLFGSRTDDDDDDTFDLWSADEEVGHDVVLNALSKVDFEDASAVADRLEAPPWEVLAMCRRLVREKLAVEGKGRERGHFRRS